MKVSIPFSAGQRHKGSQVEVDLKGRTQIVSIPFSAGQRHKVIMHLIIASLSLLFLSLFQQGKDLKHQGYQHMWHHK